MPIRKPKPTSPGRRFVSYPDFAEITKTSPSGRSSRGSRRPAGATPTAARPRATAAAAPSACTARSTSSAARTACRRSVAAIEYDPNRTAYIALLHYADGEKRYILAPARLNVGMMVAVRRGRRHRGRQLPAAREDADRHRRSQRRAAARPRRPAGALGRRRRPADGQGRRHGDAAPALGRDADRARRMPRDRRHDRQRRAPERQDRQGRPQAPHGRAPADARRRDEPGRPPARRRRGLDDRRSPPGDAVGRADARLPHAQEEQGVRPLHRARPPPREGQAG